MSNNQFVYSSLLTSIVFLTVPVFQVACRSQTSASTQLSDSSITTSVKSKMIASSAVKAGDIDVNTEEGTVYLVGRVATAAERAEAERIAWSCDGVRKVVNDIKVGQQG
jgi:hyperosmotically inducible protein